MSKTPALKHLPLCNHRSASVREQQPGQQSPRLQKSSTTYHGHGRQEAAPVEIGSKGSILSLVDRDTSASHGRANSETTSKESVWHNKLWLVLPSASKKPDASRKASKRSTAAESSQENRAPKWKRLLQKLKGSSVDGKFKSKQRVDRDAFGNDGSEKSSLDRRSSVPLRRPNNPDSAHIHHASAHSDFSQTGVLSPTSIWERRKFLQISPLDLSHFQTPRLKQAFATPLQLRQPNAKPP